MKTIFKIFLVILTILFLFISIYSGLRILHTPYTYEYLNNSMVVTIPNKLWFEINNQQDYTTKDTKMSYIFENDLLDSSREGYDLGLQYPIYTGKTENDIASKTDIVSRNKDTVSIQRNIHITDFSQFDTYTSRISFSEFGIFRDDAFTQEGCNILINSEKGVVQYDEGIASVEITYNSEENISDIINITITCLKL